MTNIKGQNEIERDDIFDRNKLLNPLEKDKQFQQEGTGKSLWFNLMFYLMIFVVLSLLYRGIILFTTNDYLFRSFLNEDAPEMPQWYPISTIILSIVSLVGLILTYMFRKIGPFVVVISLFLAATIQPEFMADGTLYTLFALFVFIGYGLAIIYPYWNKFK